MQQLTSKHSLGDWVAQYPSAARYFQQSGLDYCCGGQRSLSLACQELGLEPETVIQTLASELPAAGPQQTWTDRPLGELITYILARYHTPLRDELQRLLKLAARIEQVHGGNPHCPDGLTTLLSGIRQAVAEHLEKEEQLLFPRIIAGEWTEISNPAAELQDEHDEHGRNLARLRSLCSDFLPPEEACASWQELYRSLEELETDLMNHIHLENNILFPRALAESTG